MIALVHTLPVPSFHLGHQRQPGWVNKLPLDAALHKGAEDEEGVSCAAQGLGSPGMGGCHFLYLRGHLSGTDKERLSGLSQNSARPRGSTEVAGHRGRDRQGDQGTGKSPPDLQLDEGDQRGRSWTLVPTATPGRRGQRSAYARRRLLRTSGKVFCCSFRSWPGTRSGGHPNRGTNPGRQERGQAGGTRVQDWS